MTVEEVIVRLKALGVHVSLVGRTDMEGAAALLEIKPGTLQDWFTDGKPTPKCSLRNGPRAQRFFEISEVLAFGARHT